MRARLTLESGDCIPPSLDLSPNGQPVTLGRSRDNTIVLRDELASRLHAKIYFEDGRWHVRDFGLNGTRVDGTRVNGSAALQDGQRVKIGEVALKFVLEPKSSLAGSPAMGTPSPSAPATMRMPPNLVVENPHKATKVVEMPGERLTRTPEPDGGDKQLRVDELTALCKFMSAAVEARTPHDLVNYALRAILNQTTARIAGYLSFDPDDPGPKIVMPESAAIDVPLSRRLTAQAQKHGKTIWLFPALSASHPPTDSLSAFADAVCVPLKGDSGPFATLHVYRTGRAFTERDVKFIEAVAGHLSHGLSILRARRTLEAENSRLRTHTPAADDIIGSSNAIMHLRQQIIKAAPQPFTVLVQGESGSGKELVALGLHRNGKRADGPMVVVNCAAIAPTLLDAELFGYKKGAFSGADRDHPGLFQQADEGTLFLDEVGELSLESQSKLLRAIEGKAFRPVGGTSDIKVDVRIVAATHRDLEKDVRAGRFRQDLLFRLRVIELRVPPLREHAEDIPELAAYFLAKVSAQCRRNFRLTNAALTKLQGHNWPGNVRQLRAAIESAAVMGESDAIDADAFHLVATAQEPTAAPAVSLPPALMDTPPSLNIDEIEEWAICKAMRQTGGNVSHAAKLLNMSRDTLHNKLKKLKEKGIDRATLTSTPAPLVASEPAPV
jgi:two-component system, NtrC family, response regulator HydG